ncbi:MAG: TetR/AcrR family transcriptional regulator [Actinomycetota bacterium]|nr:TetR/AcrR family transcriptional regulator [Actinomycetota bacterium]
MANMNDQRFVRTEAAIREAFLKLLGEMPLEKVSVRRLCEEAGISRNAFYLHYENISALYCALMGDFAGEVRAKCLASLNRLTAASSADMDLPRAIIDVLAEREDLLRMLLANDDGALPARLAEEIESVGIEAAASVYERAQDMTYGLYAAYASWGPIGMVVRWLRSTDEPLIGLLDAFEDMHRGPGEVFTRYLVGDAS